MTANNALYLGGTAAASYQLNSTLAANVATMTANNATYINGNTVVSVMESLRANRSVTGGGTITVDDSGYVFWNYRFIVISSGYGSHFSTNGYFDIDCPTSGTITGVGGATNKTATTAGIPLGSWEALYYILPIGSSNVSIAANYRVVLYSSSLEIPSNWILLCINNPESGNFYFNNGIILKAGQSFAGATFTSANMPSANNASYLGGTAAASYQLNSTLSANVATLAANSSTYASSSVSNTFTVGTASYFVSNGNFGIGRNNPTEKIHVEGNILATLNVTAYSDIKLKTDVTTIDNALDKVSKMRGVMYTRIDSGTRGTGVIAQEIREVLPEVVLEGETLSVAYGNIVGVLIEAIKELKAEVDQLKGK